MQSDTGPELEVCRHLADHGGTQEWKPGCDWATEELLRKCEASGLVTVRWRDPDGIYPWSGVDLTAEGWRRVNLTDWDEVQKTVDALHPITKAQIILLFSTFELGGWHKENGAPPIMFGPNKERGISVWYIAQATGLTAGTIRRRAKAGNWLYKANNVPKELTASNRGVDAVSMDALPFLIGGLDPRYIRDARKRVGVVALHELADEVITLTFQLPEVKERFRELVEGLGLTPINEAGDPDQQPADPQPVH